VSKVHGAQDGVATAAGARFHSSEGIVEVEVWQKKKKRLPYLKCSFVCGDFE